MESLRGVADSFGQLVIPGLSFLSDPERTQAVDRALTFAQKNQLFLILDPLPEWNDDFASGHVERIHFPGLDSMETRPNMEPSISRPSSFGTANAL